MKFSKIKAYAKYDLFLLISFRCKYVKSLISVKYKFRIKF